MDDCLIIGGGVIGLSLAYELAARGRRVRVIDQGIPGRAASWAGAGMLPPASATSTEPVEQFCHLANQLHAEWAVRLRDETGIDTGYRRSGALYIARDEKAADALGASAAHAGKTGVSFDLLLPRELVRIEPAIDPATLLVAYHAPGECQLRNPWHLKALEAACRQRRVEIIANAGVEQFEIRNGSVMAVQTPLGRLPAEQFCITAGAWAGLLGLQLGLNLSMKPIRGQIALLRLAEPALIHIINEGPRYLVPRDDGRVLVGSTMEDVGFDTSTTSLAIEELVSFARSLAPALHGATLEAQWAGLRPASADGLPYLGQIQGLKNCYLAAGHTRSGLHLSPATAVTMAQRMSGEKTSVDLTPFRVDRP